MVVNFKSSAVLRHITVLALIGNWTLDFKEIKFFLTGPEILNPYPANVEYIVSS